MASADSTSPSQPRVFGLLASSTILSGATRFIPVPFVDDIMTKRVHKSMVSKLLARHGRRYELAELEPLFGSGEHWASRTLKSVVSFPVKLAVKLAKKAFRTVFFVLLVREAGLAMGESFLLGHTLHRLLGRGELGDELTGNQRRERARQIRAAFDQVVTRTDIAFLQHLFGQVVDRVGPLSELGDKLRPEDAKPNEVVDELDKQEQARVREAESEVRDALDDDEVQSFLSEFGERFDASLREAA